jgi:hypothetical protein
MKPTRRPIGVWMLCAWALGLIVQVVSRTLLLSFRQTPVLEWEFTLTLPVVAITAAYIFALGAAAVGLWQRRNWGRRLFLALLTLYYGLLLVGSISVWGPLIGLSLSAPGQGWVTAVFVESICGLGFGWWYLNRNAVKCWFTADRTPHQEAGRNHGPDL